MTNKIWKPELSNHQDFKVGDGCTIHSHTWIGSKVIIGDRCKIEPFVFIPDGTMIGNDVFIGPGTVICNDKYPPSNGKCWEGVMIESGASIGANCTILPGIKIGKNSMIGAGSVVTQDVGCSETWIGNPAKNMYNPKR
jgi:UDP-2-acetamido-3-amino-2,3-dideoxy-glucuronate N-acetyltransferase